VLFEIAWRSTQMTFVTSSEQIRVLSSKWTNKQNFQATYKLIIPTNLQKRQLYVGGGGSRYSNGIILNDLRKNYPHQVEFLELRPNFDNYLHNI
jgi:hypothetical protein